MTKLRRIYRDVITSILDGILEDQADALDEVRDVVAKALRENKIIHVVGSGHSHLLAEEVFYRAGGIASAQAILDEDLMLHRGAERSTEVERESGQAARVLANYPIVPGDVMFIASNSGRNAYPIEMAILAKAAGATTVAVTSLAHANQVTSRHVTGRRLFELTDHVLDNGGSYGDGSLDIAGLPTRMGPTSTIVGAYLLNTVIAEAVEQLTMQGRTVDVFRSANSDQDGETSQMIARWRGRIRGL